MRNLPILALALALPACKHRDRTGLELARDEQAWTMQQHFHDTFVAWESVLAGDLERARATGRALVAEAKPIAHPNDKDKLHPAFVEAVDAMAELAYAKDLQDAAHATARVGVGCGGCHAALSADVQMPTVEVPPAPPADNIPAVMAHHKASTAAMWRALVLSDQDALQLAAEQLQSGTVAPSGTPVDSTVSQEGTQLEVAVHDAAARVARATDRAARADAFGDMLMACTTCHAYLDGGPNAVPPPSEGVEEPGPVR